MFSEKSPLGWGGGGGTLSLSSEYILAWFSDVRGRSRFLRFSPWSERHLSARFAHQYFSYLTTYFARFPWSQATQATIAHKAPVVLCAGYLCRLLPNRRLFGQSASIPTPDRDVVTKLHMVDCDVLMWTLWDGLRKGVIRDILMANTLIALLLFE